MSQSHRRAHRRLSARTICCALASAAFAAGCSAETPTEETMWPGDVWAESTPEAEGINPDSVRALVADIEAGSYGLVDAFLLIRHGKVVANHRFAHNYDSIAAQYDTTNHQYNYDHPAWHPYLRDTRLHTLQSVTKSVTSAALGIAIDEGLLGGPDTPVMPFFAAYAPYETDARKEATTLEDLLTMRSGLAWTTESAYGTGEHSTDLLEGSAEWIRFVLSQPMDTTPGSRFEYNDGASVLIGKILREATGQRVEEWTRDRLFTPIGISEFYWKETPDGETDTEGGLYLATEDLARLGLLFLRGGEWDGQQVISREWVEASVTPVVTDILPDNDRPDPGYGYQWWIPDTQGESLRIFAANGYGGQFVVVSPDHDIVAVFNGWGIHGGAERSTYRALQQRILPTVAPTASASVSPAP